MTDVLILAPRLDVTFKEGPVPPQRSDIAPIREHWRNFTNELALHHKRKGDKITLVELPLWKITKDVIAHFACDVVYVPHKSESTLPMPAPVDCRYYMQSVFPFMFYVDPVGFAGGASRYPFTLSPPKETSFYEEMQERARQNESKFSQPSGKTFRTNARYAFFACQIPHDETIKYHSAYSVEDALASTCDATQKLGIPLIVKGHPVNPASMVRLKEICRRYEHTIWVEDISIHSLIEGALAVIVVNSGVGMEALLHERPVITFGRCEYDCVTTKASPDTIETALQSAHFDAARTKVFFENWYDWCVDTRHPESFARL